MKGPRTTLKPWTFDIVLLFHPPETEKPKIHVRRGQGAQKDIDALRRSSMQKDNQNESVVSTGNHSYRECPGIAALMQMRTSTGRSHCALLPTRLPHVLV